MSKIETFFIILAAIAFSATGELFLKHGMNQVGVLSLQPKLFFNTLWRAFNTPYVLVGFIFAFLASILWLAVLSRVPLSWAYPMLSLTYVVIVVTSWLILGEHLSPYRIAGVLVICSGVAIIFRG